MHGLQTVNRTIIVMVATYLTVACSSNASPGAVYCDNGDTQTVRCGVDERGTKSQVCVNYSWTDQSGCVGVHECSHSEPARIDTNACGPNDRGDLEYICDDDYTWTPIKCHDVDVCKNGATQTRSCGTMDSGTIDSVCENGQWEANHGAECEGAWDCSDGQERDLQNGCGINGRGTLHQSCGSDHTWISGNCDDDDVCKDAMTRERDCTGGVGADGFAKVQSQDCEQGQWSAWSDCHDSSACTPGDDGTYACGPDGNQTGEQHRSCPDSGVWERSVCRQKAFHITAGAYGYLLRTEQQTMLAFGDNRHHTLGDDDATDSLAAVPISTRAPDPGGDDRRFSGSVTHQCGINADGLLFCWGQNDDGELGPAVSGAFSAAPVQVNLAKTVKAVATGIGFSCALTTSRDVYCWGKNDRQQLGRDSDVSSSSTPQKVMTGVSQITAGDAYVCVVKNNAVWCWGANDEHQASPDAANTIASPRRNAQLSHDPGSDNPPSSGSRCESSLVQHEIAAIAAGRAHTLVLWKTTWQTQKYDGLLFLGACRDADVVQRTNLIGVGSNDHGQLASAQNPAVQATVIESMKTDPLAYRLLAVGDTTCVDSQLSKEKARALRCMGSNDEGQIADGHADVHALTALPTDLGDGENIAEIALGRDSICALLSETHSIRCRGGNDHGQLGDTTTTSRDSSDFVLNAIEMQSSGSD